MCLEVVHYQDISTAHLRKQFLREPCDKAVTVGGIEHRIEKNPAAAPDRAQQGQALAAVHRHSVNELFATPHPGMAAAHRDGHPRFVEEDETVRWNPPNMLQEYFAPLHYIRAQTLQRPSAFFFTT